jgi:hypothetical protein
VFYVSADSSRQNRAKAQSSKGDRRKKVDSRQFKIERQRKRKRAKRRDAEYTEVRNGDGFKERGGDRGEWTVVGVERIG